MLAIVGTAAGEIVGATWLARAPVLVLRDAIGTTAVDNQLLAEDVGALRFLDPREWLLWQAGHLTAYEAEEVNVVSAAFAGVAAMTPEAPYPIDALHAVEQAGFLKSREGAVQRDPIEASCLRTAGDLLVGERPVHLVEHLEDDAPSLRSAKSGKP